MLETAKIRKAERHDLRPIAQLCAEGFSKSLRWQGPYYQVRRWWTLAIGSESCEIWVALNQNRIAGLAILILDAEGWKSDRVAREGGMLDAAIRVVYSPRSAFSRLFRRISSNDREVVLLNTEPQSSVLPSEKTWLELIVVARSFRKQRIAAQLLSVLEHRSRELGRAAIGLSVDNDNAAACLLYQRHGYLKKSMDGFRSTWEKRL